MRILAEQSDALDAAVRDANRGAEIAFNEYQAGTVDYTTVATAQATQLSQPANGAERAAIAFARCCIADWRLGGRLVGQRIA